ncbi:M20/M25/M40 family metallo-hydrolase [Sphingoaurantiacus capsulatus]|uniref:M20/M25/M40 family metallo-hydrolase n=1 Tax=Sphingoaurantiacus capsulatus TaxID=1771310 RepID=UPI0036D211BF
MAAAPADWVAANQSKILAEYAELLAIPNVASDIPNIRRNADHIVGMMRTRGLSPRLLEGSGPTVPPAIYGEWKVPGAKRTLILYAHYDGQPVTPEDWKSTAPFEPKLLTARLDKGGKEIPLPSAGTKIDPDWRLYGRSASDDKAGVMAILSAVDALKAEGKRPAFNLKIFFEGEEEAGSPNLGDLLKRHKNMLQSDGWVIFDGPAHQTGAKQVVLGVRGVLSADIIVYGPSRPLHSGHYGNWAPNPAMMMSQLLASMKDDSGRVTVAGFYDDVTPLTAAEKAAVAAVPNGDAALKDDLFLGWTEGGKRPLIELTHEPSLNVDGVRSADVGEKARNVVPSTAMATIDMRLVAGNDHQRQFDKVVAHIRKQGYFVTDKDPTPNERRQHGKVAKVVKHGGYNAERTPLGHPLARDVAAAVRTVHADAVVLPSLGGSLPLYLLREGLSAPSVTLSLANHDNSQHAEDENLRLGNLWDAIGVAATVMTMGPVR